MPNMTYEQVALLSAEERLERARQALAQLRLSGHAEGMGDGALADEIERLSDVDFESALLAVLTDARAAL